MENYTQGSGFLNVEDMSQHVYNNPTRTRGCEAATILAAVLSTGIGKVSTRDQRLPLLQRMATVSCSGTSPSRSIRSYHARPRLWVISGPGGEPVAASPRAIRLAREADGDHPLDNVPNILPMPSRQDGCRSFRVGEQCARPELSRNGFLRGSGGRKGPGGSREVVPARRPAG